jgi:hypothetical protein
MLAGHLGMTVGEIETRMDSHELSEWLAYARYFQPLDNSWLQTGIMASAFLLPYSKRGRAPQASDFVPIENPPQHRSQIHATLLRMKQDLEGKK